MRAWVAAATVTLMLTGCATATAGTRVSTSSQLRTGGGTAGPPSGSRAGAQTLARELMAWRPLPPGTRSAGRKRVPPQLDSSPGIPGTGFVLRTRLLTAPARAGSVAAFLLAHRPHGARVSTSQAGAAGPPDATWVMFDLARPGYQTELGFGLLPVSGDTTPIKEYAFVVWYPPRSAAEHIATAGFGSVTVTAQLPDQGKRTTRTFTSHAVIDRLAGALNALPAAPYYAVPCPDFATYSLRFWPAKHGVRAVLVATLSCVADQVVAGGVAQPPLWDLGQLGALARVLLDRPPRR